MKIYDAIQVERTINRMLANQPLVRRTDNYTEHQMKDELKKKVAKK